RSFLLPERARVPTMIHHVTDMVVDDKLLKLIGLFVFNYLLIYVVSVIVLLFYYPNNGGVLFEVASALSNVGLTSGLMTSTSPTVTKLVFILDFWVGRLEIWPVLLSVTIAMNMLRRTLKRRSKT
ncbi:MAG: TrkH family potassium uptake protein, partial [Chloroflexi bacterium]|nr:TrkH family potassium uptake protein [Chloroflexota bacterium]